MCVLYVVGNCKRCRRWSLCVIIVMYIKAGVCTSEVCVSVCVYLYNIYYYYFGEFFFVMRVKMSFSEEDLLTNCLQIIIIITFFCCGTIGTAKRARETVKEERYDIDGIHYMHACIHRRYGRETYDVAFGSERKLIQMPFVTHR